MQIQHTAPADKDRTGAGIAVAVMTGIAADSADTAVTAGSVSGSGTAITTDSADSTGITHTVLSQTVLNLGVDNYRHATRREIQRAGSTTAVTTVTGGTTGTTGTTGIISAAPVTADSTVTTVTAGTGVTANRETAVNRTVLDQGGTVRTAKDGCT